MLRTLSLQGCDITNCMELAYSLGTNTTLTRLNLRDNFLQDGGAVAICYAIQGKLFVLEGPLSAAGKIDAHGELRRLSSKARRKLDEEVAQTLREEGRSASSIARGGALPSVLARLIIASG